MASVRALFPGTNSRSLKLQSFKWKTIDWTLWVPQRFRLKWTQTNCITKESIASSTSLTQLPACHEPGQCNIHQNVRQGVRVIPRLGNVEQKKLGRPKRRWDDNIKIYLWKIQNVHFKREPVFIIQHNCIQYNAYNTSSCPYFVTPHEEYCASSIFFSFPWCCGDNCRTHYFEMSPFKWIWRSEVGRSWGPQSPRNEPFSEKFSQ